MSWPVLKLECLDWSSGAAVCQLCDFGQMNDLILFPEQGDWGNNSASSIEFNSSSYCISIVPVESEYSEKWQ